MSTKHHALHAENKWLVLRMQFRGAAHQRPGERHLCCNCAQFAFQRSLASATDGLDLPCHRCRLVTGPREHAFPTTPTHRLRCLGFLMQPVRLQQTMSQQRFLLLRTRVSTLSVERSGAQGAPTLFVRNVCSGTLERAHTVNLVISILCGAPCNRRKRGWGTNHGVAPVGPGRLAPCTWNCSQEPAQDEWFDKLHHILTNRQSKNDHANSANALREKGQTMSCGVGATASTTHCSCLKKRGLRFCFPTENTTKPTVRTDCYTASVDPFIKIIRSCSLLLQHAFRIGTL